MTGRHFRRIPKRQWEGWPGHWRCCSITSSHRYIDLKTGLSEDDKDRIAIGMGYHVATREDGSQFMYSKKYYCEECWNRFVEPKLVPAPPAVLDPQEVSCG